MKSVEAIEHFKGILLAVDEDKKIEELMHDRGGNVRYRYGMRLRGFSIGCQPMEGLIEARDDILPDRYYNLLIYDRKLTDEEIEEYELDYLGEQTPAVLD